MLPTVQLAASHVLFHVLVAVIIDQSNVIVFIRVY